MGLHDADAIDKIYLRIEALKKYVAIISKFKVITLEELERDDIKRGAVERYIQLAIESCIDIAELIISDQRLPTPETAKRAIEILGEQGILDQKFAKSFSKAAGFRNILIHEYVMIDYKQLLANLKNNLTDFERFIKEILEFIG